MNDFELSALLFYADYLSLKAISLPVTDNCKYFYIHGVPVNSAFILDMTPVYDEQNIYLQQARVEYDVIKNKYGDEGLESFIDEICCINACGSVDAERMLNRIHQFSDKKQRKLAFNAYRNWYNNQTFYHKIANEDGDIEEKPCSKYVYHVERMLGKRIVD